MSRIGSLAYQSLPEVLFLELEGGLGHSILAIDCMTGGFLSFWLICSERLLNLILSATLLIIKFMIFMLFLLCLADEYADLVQFF